MKRFLRIIAASALAVSLCLTLVGCAFLQPLDDLYCLPELDPEYVALQNQLNILLANGATYSAPSAGTNRQAIQMQDLNGDGETEAVVFLDYIGQERPLRVAVFRRSGDVYVPLCTIDGDGRRFDSVTYLNMDGDGYMELLVGWQISAEVRMLSVYAVADGAAKMLLSTDYTEYAVSDMNSDGTDDLLVARLSSAEHSGEVTMYRLMEDGEVADSTAQMTEGVEALTHMRTTPLKDGTASLLLESTYDSSNVVTDLFAEDAGMLKNLTAVNGVNETLRSYAVYSRDLNSDGVLEVPYPVRMPSASGSPFWSIEWYAYSSSGQRALATTTYHNASDGWYLRYPENWANNISVRREDTDTGARVVIFSVYSASTDTVGSDFLAIYTFSGAQAGRLAELDGRFIVGRSSGTVYAAKILNSMPSVAPDEATVKENFNIIYSEWMNGQT